MAGRAPSGRSGVSTSTGRSGWSTASIAPPQLPLPPGFLTPEQVAQQSIVSAQTEQFKPITADDFLTVPNQAADPKLESRTFSSTPTTQPVQVGASVSAFGNAPAPAFLTNAVNKLNATQSAFQSSENAFRNELLDAVLSGNYLAAEALRAAAVRPGTSVSFGGSVENPQIGQGYLLQSQSAADEAASRKQALGQQVAQTGALQAQLNSTEQQLRGIPRSSNTLATASQGQKTAGLQFQQRQLQQQLERQREILAGGGAFASSGFVPSLPRYGTL